MGINNKISHFLDLKLMLLHRWPTPSLEAQIWKYDLSRAPEAQLTRTVSSKIEGECSQFSESTATSLHPHSWDPGSEEIPVNRVCIRLLAELQVLSALYRLASCQVGCPSAATGDCLS